MEERGREERGREERGGAERGEEGASNSCVLLISDFATSINATMSLYSVMVSTVDMVLGACSYMPSRK